MPTDFLTLMLDGRVPMKFRLIPPGEFRMGSRGFNANEEPMHRVRITHPFYIGVYPVTQLQWRTIVETVPSINNRNTAGEQDGLKAEPSDFKGDNRPVENVSWHDSGAWCQRLQASSVLSECVDDAGQRVEIARVICQQKRSGNMPVGWFKRHRVQSVGTRTTIQAMAKRHCRQRAGIQRILIAQTHDVGGKAPNGIGLHDMHGNVWEWCRDAWSEDAYKLRIDGVADPLVSASDVGESENDAVRVFRGGSWGNSARYCRAASRLRWRARLPRWLQGFRVCLFFGPVPSQQTGTGVTSEPVPVDVARRQAAAESEDSGGEVTEVDLASERLPKRSDGTKF